MNTEELIAKRIAFWTAFDEQAPELGIDPQKPWEKTFGLAVSRQVKVTLSLTQVKSSVYLVGRTVEARNWIEANQSALARRLLTTTSDGSGWVAKGIWFRKDNKNACFTQRGQWPEAFRFFRDEYAIYSKAVKETEAEQ